jgi:tetratricopeptide (TPR) repeat protein
MSQREWYRRVTWNDADRTDFYAHLARSRGAWRKAQYLRIQAAHLANAGHHAAAIELIDRMLAEFPERTELASAHMQKAESLLSPGKLADAIQEYRAALQSERELPNVRTSAWLDFGWLVLKRRLTAYYDEISQVLREFRQEGGVVLPTVEYRFAALQALLADHNGEKALAREFARRALAEAEKQHSGLRYHPTVGLVGRERDTFASRLRTLAGK